MNTILQGNRGVVPMVGSSPFGTSIFGRLYGGSSPAPAADPSAHPLLADAALQWNRSSDLLSSGLGLCSLQVPGVRQPLLSINGVCSACRLNDDTTLATSGWYIGAAIAGGVSAITLAADPGKHTYSNGLVLFLPASGTVLNARLVGVKLTYRTRRDEYNDAAVSYNLGLFNVPPGAPLNLGIRSFYQANGVLNSDPYALRNAYPLGSVAGVPALSVDTTVLVEVSGLDPADGVPRAALENSYQGRQYIAQSPRLARQFHLLPGMACACKN